MNVLFLQRLPTHSSSQQVSFFNMLKGFMMCKLDLVLISASKLHLYMFASHLAYLGKNINSNLYFTKERESCFFSVVAFCNRFYILNAFTITGNFKTKCSTIRTGKTDLFTTLEQTVGSTVSIPDIHNCIQHFPSLSETPESGLLQFIKYIVQSIV